MAATPFIAAHLKSLTDFPPGHGDDTLSTSPTRKQGTSKNSPASCKSPKCAKSAAVLPRLRVGLVGVDASQQFA